MYDILSYLCVTTGTQALCSVGRREERLVRCSYMHKFVNLH